MDTIEDFLASYDSAVNAARDHARDEFPEESCGLIVDGKYIRCENGAAHPSYHDSEDPDCGCKLCSFKISAADYARHSGKIDIVVHSHPNGPLFPSAADMQSQESSNLPWMIIPLDDVRYAPPVIWGPGVPKEPIIGREFMHGVTDCYDLIHDVFAAGKEELARQGVDEAWPFDPIQLPTYPRQDGWWELGGNFYEEEPEKIGFVEVNRGEVKPGDIFLCQIKSERLNHGGVLLSNDLILHHLPNRLSRREPAGLWAYSAVKWIRYVGVTHE